MWKSITEETKLKPRIICFNYGWGTWEIRCWKFNPRIGVEYWGDAVEMDDYEDVDNQPTIYLEFDECPS